MESTPVFLPTWYVFYSSLSHFVCQWRRRRDCIQLFRFLIKSHRRLVQKIFRCISVGLISLQVQNGTASFKAEYYCLYDLIYLYTCVVLLLDWRQWLWTNNCVSNLLEALNAWRCCRFKFRWSRVTRNALLVYMIRPMIDSDGQTKAHWHETNSSTQLWCRIKGVAHAVIVDAA